MSCLLALILLRTPLYISGVNFVMLTIIKIMSTILPSHGQNFVPGWRGKLFYRCVTCGLASQSDFLTSIVIWVRQHSIFQASAPKDSNRHFNGGYEMGLTTPVVPVFFSRIWSTRFLPWLIGSCCLWQVTNRPIDDFPYLSLHPLLWSRLIHQYS